MKKAVRTMGAATDKDNYYRTIITEECEDSVLGLCQAQTVTNVPFKGSLPWTGFFLQDWLLPPMLHLHVYIISQKSHQIIHLSVD